MKQPSRRAITNRLDKIFSVLVRQRGFCKWCGKRDNLQACHIFSRANRSVRWDKFNVICMCAGCHFKAHQNPLEFTEFIKRIYTEKEYGALIVRAHLIARWSIEELVNMEKELKTNGL